MKKSVFILLALSLFGCASNDSSKPIPHDPTVLVDVYERQILKDCSGGAYSDQIVRNPAVNSIKINPDQNIYIASASFFNLESGDEFTPSGVWIKGPGGDNLKWVKFCQAPKPRNAGCDLAVNNGDNKIEYKYWSQERPDILGENKIRIINFKTSSTTTNRVCTREPEECPLRRNSRWKDCRY